MAIEAPFSKYRKTNLKIYIFVCIALAIWFCYDGYFNEKFREKHTVEGVPDPTLVFNQKSPFFFAGTAVILGVYLCIVRNRKIVADETALIVENHNITYDSIEKVDKTYFASKGFFIITYTEPAGNKAQLKLGEKKYDNLTAILEHLVAKIS